MTKKHQPLDNPFIECLIEFLSDRLKDKDGNLFSTLKTKHQQSLAELILQLFSESRYKMHKNSFNGYSIVISSTDKRQLFSREKTFNDLNSKFDIFELVHGYSFSYGEQEGVSNGYKLTAKMKLLEEQFFNMLLNDEIQPKSFQYKKLRTPVVSLSCRNGKNVKTKQTHKNSSLCNLVGISSEMLSQLASTAHEALQSEPERHRISSEFQTQFDDWTGRIEELNFKLNALNKTASDYKSQKDSITSELERYTARIRRIRNNAILMSKMGSKHGDSSCIQISYNESASGRLFATKFNPNPQGVPREVRKAAFYGHYDIDIENCHYALLWNEAKQCGLELKTVKIYLDNKKQIREELVAHTGLPVDIVKEGLLAIIYGCSGKPYYQYKGELLETTLLKDMGKSGFKLFFEHPFVLMLLEERDIAQQTIIKRYVAKHQTKNGHINNKYGTTKSIKGAVCKNGSIHKNHVKSLLSHILQGAERAILDVMIECLDGTKIALLQHDGLTYRECVSRDELDKIESTILERTGYEIQIGDAELLSFA